MSNLPVRITIYDNIHLRNKEESMYQEDSPVKVCRDIKKYGGASYG